MASLADWNKYMTLLHEYALVEYDLREVVANPTWYYDAPLVADHILFERLGVDTQNAAPVLFE